MTRPIIIGRRHLFVGQVSLMPTIEAVTLATPPVSTLKEVLLITTSCRKIPYLLFVNPHIDLRSKDNDKRCRHEFSMHVLFSIRYKLSGFSLDFSW